MKSITKYLALILLYASSTSVYSMESAKKAELKKLGAKHKKEVKMFMDAYQKGIKSKFFKPALENARLKTRKLKHSRIVKNLIASCNIECLFIFVAESNQLSIMHPRKKSVLLHLAASAGHASFCHFLLEANILPVDTLDNELSTPLHKAAVGGRVPTCQVLLAHNANVHARNITLRNPAQEALISGSTRNSAAIGTIISLLVQNGCRLDLVNPIGQLGSVLDTLVFKKDYEYFKAFYPILFAHAVSPAHKDPQGATILHRLASSLNADITTGIKSFYNAEQNAEKVIGTMALRHLRYWEAKTAFTVLLGNRFSKDSPISLLHKDMLQAHIIPHLTPFRSKNIQECVKLQLAFLKELLEIADDTGQLAYHYVSSNVQTHGFKPRALFNPDNIELWRRPLTILTRKAMQKQNQIKEHA